VAAGERLNTLRPRAQAMLERVTSEARAVLTSAEANIVRGALAEALGPRDAHIDDDHDPRALHPARTIRILIADGACRSVDALAAAAFVDTIDPHLAPAPPTALLRSLVDAVPRPERDGDRLLERIVTADHDVALVTLVERLDHARHLHLRSELPWPQFHADVRTVYIPAARRLAARIARRYERWADAFERRLILPR
jgi:(p)ppGpp synthase/HD superfamily hydrolase